MEERSLEQMRQAVDQLRQRMDAAARQAGRSPAEVQLCAAQPHIQVRGLMAVPPVNRDDRQNRADLAAVHRLYVRAGEQGYSNVRMEILSMGMSGDFENAIREGATLVRIGTAIYGQRDYGQVRKV